MNTLAAYDRALRDFTRKLEAQEGICCEPGDCFVAEEDREPSTTVGIFDAIPFPDPIRKLSDDEE